jgi:hypothetical protein
MDFTKSKNNMKPTFYLTYILLLAMGYVQAQTLSNGDFETFGMQTTQLYTRDGGSYNGETCMIDGGTIQEAGTYEGTGRPIGFATTDDAFEQSPSTVEQTTDANTGASAIRLTTNGFDVIGLVGLFEPEVLRQELIPVAYPFTAVPTSIDGFYRHMSGVPRSFPPGTCTSDGQLEETRTYTGAFKVYAVMTAYNDTTGEDEVVATVNSQFPDATDYTAFSAPVTVVQPGTIPDKIIFAMSSSPEFISPNPVAIVGSRSFVDDVDFIFPVLSIEETIDKTTEFSVYPNPATSQVSFITETSKLQYKLYNVTGKLVLQGHTQSKNHQINISSMPPGMYFLNTKLGVTKLIVN